MTLIENLVTKKWIVSEISLVALPEGSAIHLRIVHAQQGE